MKNQIGKPPGSHGINLYVQISMLGSLSTEKIIG